MSIGGRGNATFFLEGGGWQMLLGRRDFCFVDTELSRWLTTNRKRQDDKIYVNALISMISSNLLVFLLSRTSFISALLQTTKSALSLVQQTTLFFPPNKPVTS